MPNDDKPRRASGQVEPKEGPDERLRRELLRINKRKYEEPEQRVYERGFAIAERLSLELPRLTDLARVPLEPPQRRDYFRRVVLDVVLDAWDNDDSRKAASALRSTSPALSRAIDALRSAKRLLADLDQRDREALWWCILEVEGGIDRLEMVLGGTKLTQSQRGPKPTQPGRMHRPGKPAGTITNWPFQIFVRDLLRAAECCGGRLTFDKHNGKGTLTEAIDILTPCLPAGFVPKALPLTTIQRIKSRATKQRR
jgi:hypothetical protein